MKVKVRWFGFHDSKIHESDIIEEYSEVQKFIYEGLGDPEAMTAYLIDATTGKRITFNDFKNCEVIK